MKQPFLLFLLASSLFLSNLQAINPPTNAAPTNGINNQPTAITIDWLAVTGNVGYLYEVDTTPNFNSSFYSIGTTATNSSQATLSNLYFGTTYYWRAATIGPIDTSVWGSTWSFSTGDDLTNVGPTNGASNLSTSVDIDWVGVAGNTGYLYEVDTTPSFNSSWYQNGTTTTNSSQYSLTNLYFGTTYYWRAAIKNAVDTSGWGATWSFTTLDNVTNIAPSDGALNLPTSVTIDWTATDNTGYLYEVDTTPLFNSSLYSSGLTAINSSQFDLSNLYFGTTYYWRAAVTNASDTSNWSATWSFTTLDDVTNTAPGDGSINQPTSLNIDWAPMTGNTGYLYEVDTTPNFNSTFYQSGTTIPNSSQAGLSDLRFGTTYYWRAAIKNNVDTSAWGPTWSFTTLDIILNFSPNNNSFGEPTSTILDWSSMTGNTGYLYEIDTTPNFNSAFYNNGTTAVNSSQVSISDLYFGTTYYWRAAVKNNVDTSEWSAIWNFTTTDGIFHISPANGATSVVLNPTLDWSSMAGNTGYMYRIDTSLSFNSPLLQTGTTITNSSSIGITNLQYGTTYYWSVAIKNNVDTSSWSVATDFTTAYQITAIPLLISPADGSINIPLAPLQLTWDSIPAVSSYQLEYSTDSTFATIINSSYHTQLSTTITGLSNYTKYFWRVRGANAAGFSPWSLIWSFETENINVSIYTVPKMVLQLYPNPVQDMLNLDLVCHHPYILRIIDAKGQVISEQSYLSTTKIQYNAAELSPGIYFLQIHAGELVESVQFVKK